MAPTDVDAGDLTIIEPLCAVFRRALKSVGQKYTPERAMILEAVISLAESRGLFDADELITDLAARVAAAPAARIRVSKATVYRTLKLLADAGIVQQILLGADQAHYQLAYGRGGTGLLVNMDTEHAEPVEIPELAKIVQDLCARRGLAAEGHRLIVYAKAVGQPLGSPPLPGGSSESAPPSISPSTNGTPAAPRRIG
jgi:Fur family ferric uptake transcriptional regulator